MAVEAIQAVTELEERVKKQKEAAATQNKQRLLEAQRAAQIQVNADLQDDLEHSDDLESQMDIARDELGLVVPGEKVFPITE